MVLLAPPRIPPPPWLNGIILTIFPEKRLADLLVILVKIEENPKPNGTFR